MYLNFSLQSPYPIFLLTFGTESESGKGEEMGVSEIKDESALQSLLSSASKYEHSYLDMHEYEREKIIDYM